ncbi:hypothetical protein B0H16DRAFT_1836159 [Mycena metata]|uniref:Uncharacterized protein n=1 Tax=Mycena metata TaxID=1033252 RepID=A0AAD7NBN9_9AGAR|nr:hypothetical protein B0H16DRAFT_1836159 [Mycena metata]
MPETRESEASYIIVSEGLTTILEKDGPLVLEKLELDASEKEQKRFPKDHPANQGLPYAIDSKCTVKRGTNKAQGYVYPEMWRTPGKQQPKDLLPTLALQGISYTHRALILNLGPLFLMIQWMTHTSAQLFSRTGWESTVKVTDKKVRKFKVGLALVFKDYVLAFLTHDLAFQPTWRKLRSELPPPPDDFYSVNWAFIPTLATWIRSRQTTERNGLACDAIRAANDVFLGIGVYTVVGLFFLQYLHRSRTGLRALLRPAMKDGFLAPTKNQRLKYIDWLYVYAKDRARLPSRMATLVDDYVATVEELSSLPHWIRADTTSLHDVLEPSLISTALSLEHNLGHLIFGDVLWVQLGGVVSRTPDKLSLLFQSQGVVQPTFLKPNHYNPLFLDANELTSQSLPRRTIYAYRDVKQMWSITPFPGNSQGIQDIKDTTFPYRIEGDERKHMLFSYIIEKTRRVAIGPLEYCGNAHRVSIGAPTVVVPCYGDPTLPEFYAVRDLKGRALPPPVPGARRQGMDSTTSKEFDYQRRGIGFSNL